MVLHVTFFLLAISFHFSLKCEYTAGKESIKAPEHSVMNTDSTVTPGGVGALYVLSVIVLILLKVVHQVLLKVVHQVLDVQLNLAG